MVSSGCKQLQEDHLISLQLGGNPVDPRNLWPEKPASPNPKDGFENYLKAMGCQRKMTLAEAQKEIATDWFKFWTDAGKPKGAAAANAKHHISKRRHHARPINAI